MAAPQQPTSSTSRGAIRTSVSTSTDGLVAGDDFSIFVTVQNPFEAPLSLHRVSTALPTEFIDVDRRSREQRRSDLEQRLGEIQGSARGLALPAPSSAPRWRRAERWLLRALRLEHRDAISTGPAIARDLSGTNDEASWIASGLSVWLGASFASTSGRRAGQKNSGAESEEGEERAATLHEGADGYERAITALRTAPPPTVLQAGNSTTRNFTVKSRHKIWFRSASYRLHIEVEYEIDGVSNIDTIEHVLQVNSSLTSVIWGSVVGGIGGWFAARDGIIRLDLRDGFSLAVSLVLVAMSVVLFARKKGVNPIISIEDFWGGVAIGFLVAYSGPKFLVSLFGPPPGASPATPDASSVGMVNNR